MDFDFSFSVYDKFHDKYWALSSRIEAIPHQLNVSSVHYVI